MPVQRTITLYTIDELEGKARDRAIEKTRAMVMEMFDPNELSELFLELLKERGIVGLEPRWRLSYSQGDGVAFYGSMDIEALRAAQPRIAEDMRAVEVTADAYGNAQEILAIRVSRTDPHYDHWNTMGVEVETAAYPADESGRKAIDHLQDSVFALLQGTSREMEREGYAYIEDEENEENIVETARLNEWLYDESGNFAGA